MKKVILLALAATLCAAAAVPQVSTATPAATAQAAKAPDWLRHAPTGEKRSDTEIVSPDGRYRVRLTPIEGLDVATYKMTMTDHGKDVSLCPQAVDATFSPDSRMILICTGPHPILYRIGSGESVVLKQIQSGLENDPVWVYRWSEHAVVLHQQKRFDFREAPRVWTINL